MNSDKMNKNGKIYIALISGLFAVIAVLLTIVFQSRGEAVDYYARQKIAVHDQVLSEINKRLDKIDRNIERLLQRD